MKLITKELERKFSKYPIYSQEGMILDAKVIVKYFNPAGTGTWLITEAEQLSDGDWKLFGYMHIFEWEWGDVLLSELQNIKLSYGLGIERDLYLADDVAVRDCI